MAVWSVLSVIATPFVYVLSDAASLFSDLNSHANVTSLQAEYILVTYIDTLTNYLFTMRENVCFFYFEAEFFPSQNC